jgi:CBS-domain-containing membrane protein
MACIDSDQYEALVRMTGCELFISTQGRYPLKVSDIMRTPVVSVAPDTRVIDAVRLLLETNRRGLPVINKAGELVGIISEGDFLHRAELGTTGRIARGLMHSSVQARAPQSSPTHMGRAWKKS